MRKFEFRTARMQHQSSKSGTLVDATVFDPSPPLGIFELLVAQIGAAVDRAHASFAASPR